MRFGIDFADEGYYLNKISDPFGASTSISQFGYIYHPLYWVASGDIALIRQLNLLMTFFLAFGLSVILINTLFGQNSIDFSSKLVAAAAISVSSLVFYRNWIPTPNYNFLAFQSLMLGMIGLLLAETGTGIKNIAGWIILGFSGWLAFMAKPTTAAVLVAISVAQVIFSGKFSARFILLAGLSAIFFFILFVLPIYGSIYSFVAKIQDAVKLAGQLSIDHEIKSLIRIDSFSLTANHLSFLILGSVFLGFFIRISYLENSVYKISWFIIYVFVSFIIVVILGSDTAFLENVLWVHLVMLLFPLGSILSAVFCKRAKVYILKRLRSHWHILVSLILFPYAFAFGTGGNYWFFYGLVSIFWVLGCLFFILPNVKSGFIYPFLSFGIVVQFVTPLVILTAIEDPYYQPNSLRKSDFAINFGRPGSQLLIPEPFGKYISKATDIARNGGFKAGTPMIDLTGRSPGVLYALSASSVGSAWIYGNYINSRKNAEDVAVEILKKVHCEEIALAWLLIEPHGPVNISTAVLNSVGANVDRDYELVGTFTTPNSAGGFPASEQSILKPKRVVAVTNDCNNLRDLI